MKKIPTFCYIVFAVLFSHTGLAQWQDLSNPQLGDIFQCKFISPSKGWIVTHQGLLRTTDGGFSWTNSLNSPPGPFNFLFAFDFLDDSLGYAATLGGRYCYRTINGGRTWGPAGCGPIERSQVSPIKIFSPNLAYCGSVVFGSRFFYFNRSVDTMHTWQTISQLSSPTGFPPDFRLFFLSKDTIVACGGVPPLIIDEWTGTIECHKSTNGGLTWGFPFVDTLAPSSVVSFGSKSVGYAFSSLLGGSYVHYKTHKTTNAGASWFQIPTTIDTSSDMQVTDAYFKNPREGFVSGGGFAHTVDGGLTWTRIPGVSGEYMSMSWFDSLHGWAAGGGGKIYRTTTGGWLPIHLASFTGRHLGGTRVRLDWRTLSETNNRGFHVQRRRQIETVFTEISQLIPGYGTSNEPHDYSWTDSNATIARWYYRLKQIDVGGLVHYTEPILVDVTTGVSHMETRYEFRLEQNYPNPFNPTAEIRYQISDVRGQTSEVNHVTLKVFDLLGREVATLVNEVKQPGNYTATFDGAGFGSGVYIARLTAGGRSKAVKLVLTR